jgi:MFS family permease
LDHDVTGNEGIHLVADDRDIPVARESVLRQSPFLRYWIGESISWFGSQVTILALPLVAISVVGASTSAVGLLVAASNGAMIAVTPFAGPWLDARAVRPVIIWTNVVRAAVLAAVPAAYFFAAVSMPLLYAVALAVGAVTGVFEIAALTYVPRLVHTAQLVDASSKVSASGAVAETAGPAVGGLLIRLITAPVAILADVLSYVVSTALLLSIRMPERVPRQEPVPGKILAKVYRGIRYCLVHPKLRLLLVATAWFNLCEQAIITAFLVYAIRVLSISATTLGAILAAAGGGAVAGAIVATRAERRFGLGKALAGGAGIAAVSLALVPVPTGTAAPFILGGAFFANGFGTGLFSVHSVAYRQTITPAGAQGQMNAGYRLFAFGTVPLGAALAGVLGGLIGTRTTIAVVAAALTAGMGWLAVHVWRRLPQKNPGAPQPGYS